jgi:hypothetical protein
MTESAAHVRVIEETPGYWRVVFDYPPFNIVDSTIFAGLQDLLARMDASPSLRVNSYLGIISGSPVIQDPATPGSERYCLLTAAVVQTVRPKQSLPRC